MLHVQRGEEQKKDSLKDFLEVYKTNYNDIRYGNITVYKKSSSLILPKAKKLVTDLEGREFLKLSKKRFACKHSNLMNMIDYGISQIDDVCNRTNKATAYFEFLPKSLLDLNRIHANKRIGYEAKDICQMLYDIVDAQAYLQYRGLNHGLIRPEYIGYDKSGTYVLCDHLLQGSYFGLNYQDSISPLQQTWYTSFEIWDIVTQ